MRWWTVFSGIMWMTSSHSWQIFLSHLRQKNSAKYSSHTEQSSGWSAMVAAAPRALVAAGGSRSTPGWQRAGEFEMGLSVNFFVFVFFLSMSGAR